jgi:ribosomal protein S8
MFLRLSLLISRINLAKAQRIDSFRIINTRINFAFLTKLESLGIIRGFEIEYDQILVYMKYVDKRVPFIHIQLVGRPGRTTPINIQRLLRVADKYGSSIFVLSTGYGFLSHTECFTFRCSGNIVARIDL